MNCRGERGQAGPYLAIPEQRWEMEEERRAQRHGLDGCVKVLTLKQLYLQNGGQREGVLSKKSTLCTLDILGGEFLSGIRGDR